MNHKEALCLMQYRCTGCLRTEILWNSRDGVTPFIVRCSECKADMQHINWQQDRPQEDMRIFMSMPITVARALARKMVERVPRDPDMDIEEYTEQLAQEYYKEGISPMVLSISALLEVVDEETILKAHPFR